jgi:hypothetical protein
MINSALINLDTENENVWVCNIAAECWVVEVGMISKRATTVFSLPSI